MKLDKIPYIIYADIGPLIKKIDGCANNTENSSTINIGENIPCGYSMSSVLAFDHIEKKRNLYRGKDCMKKFCEYLRKYAKNIIDFEKKNLTVNKKKKKNHIMMQKYVTFAEKES